jgi:hypothetical protein
MRSSCKGLNNVVELRNSYNFRTLRTTTLSTSTSEYWHSWRVSSHDVYILPLSANSKETAQSANLFNQVYNEQTVRQVHSIDD